jgi:hypothetical protein
VDFAADIVESAQVPAVAAVHRNLGRRSATPTGSLTAWLTSPMGDCHRSLKFPERAGRAPASPAHPRSRHQTPSSPNRSPTWPRRFGVYSLLRVGDTRTTSIWLSARGSRDSRLGGDPQSSGRSGKGLSTQGNLAPQNNSDWFPPCIEPPNGVQFGQQEK